MSYNLNVKNTVKDSVFTHLFKIPENLLLLYKKLHPEDTSVKVTDLCDITTENILVDDIYNDLGFRVKDKLIILVEAQSSWSSNIIIRAFLYLAKTYRDYIDDNELDVYKSTKLAIPKPELYVLYTGDRKEKPSFITLKNEFFDNDENISLDIKIKMLYGTNEDDIISQYVTFTKVYDEQRKKHGKTIEAIQETIKICKDKNVLKEYLQNKEREVTTMLMTLFSEEQIMKNHDAHLAREVVEETTIQHVKKLMKSFNLTAEQAMEALEIPESEKASLLEQI